MDVTGLKYAIRAKLLSFDKVLRFLRILENIGVRNVAKELKHLQEQAQIYRLTPVLGYQNLPIPFSRLEPCPIHSTVTGFHHRSVLLSPMKLLN